ncbi:c-type cytochrome [Pseudahrensia aquimaris]|uniref:C-type cytochrome n=1 Tax=Pseudahrensia aquimaris TaxID=744461 RepID=A0ABW3FJF1_9HYPH
MDSFEWNKIFGALLAGAFVVLGLNFLSEAIYHSEKPEQFGYAVEVDESATASASAEPEEVVIPPVAPLLASADISKGESVAKKCAACHNFNEGGANKVGPALWDIVNKQMASAEGFSYSGALKEYGADKVWSYDSLNKFLLKPKAYIKGTSMGFAGIKKVEDRAALIAYMRSLSNDPAPLPDS